MQRLPETMPDQASSELADVASRIRLGLQRAGADIVAVGLDLLAAKELVGHGGFAAWLGNEFDLSQRSAERFMAAARRFGERPDAVSNLPPGVLHELAAPGTPDEIVEGVLAGQIPATAEAVRSATGTRRRARIAVRAAQGLIDKLWNLPDDVYEAAEEIATQALEESADFVEWIAETLAGAAELINEGREASPP